MNTKNLFYCIHIQKNKFNLYNKFIVTLNFHRILNNLICLSLFKLVYLELYS